MKRCCLVICTVVSCHAHRMWALSVPVRVGYVSYTYVLCGRTSKQCAPRRSDHIHMVNISMMHRTHTRKMMTVDEDARPSGRTDGRRRLSGMLAAWRPPRLSLAASPSPRQRPPSRLQCARAARRLASRCPTAGPGVIGSCIGSAVRRRCRARHHRASGRAAIDAASRAPAAAGRQAGE